MLRVILAGCLSFLLLALQQEALVHPLQHDAARFAERKVALHTAGDTACATCALIAGGAHGLTGAAHATTAAPPAHAAIAVAIARAAFPAPRYYPSRAPPALA
jgi:hypothetical protein